MLNITQLRQDTLAEWHEDIPYGTDKFQFCYKDNKIYVALLDSDTMTQDQFIATEWKEYGGSGVGTNIYTDDGELTEDRIFDLKGFVLKLLNGVTRAKEVIVGGTSNQIRLYENALFLARNRANESAWNKDSFMINQYDAESKVELVHYMPDGTKGNHLLFSDDGILYLKDDNGLVQQAPIGRYDAKGQMLDQYGNILVPQRISLAWRWEAYVTKLYIGQNNRERTGVFRYWCSLPHDKADFTTEENISFNFLETVHNITVSSKTVDKADGTYKTRQFKVPVTGTYRMKISYTHYREKMYTTDWIGIGISKATDKMTYRFFNTNIDTTASSKLNSPFFVSYVAHRDILLTKDDEYNVIFQSFDNGYLQNVDFTLELLHL